MHTAATIIGIFLVIVAFIVPTIGGYKSGNYRRGQPFLFAGLALIAIGTGAFQLQL